MIKENNSFEVKIIKIGRLGSIDNEDTTYSEAIQSVYCYEDVILMCFGDIEVKASMCMDVSDSYRDILGMVKFLESEEKEKIVYWPSQTFFAEWQLKQDKETVYIAFNWIDIPGNSEYIEYIKGNLNFMSFTRDIFLSQWKKLLHKIENDLETVGYKNLLV